MAATAAAAPAAAAPAAAAVPPQRPPARLRGKKSCAAARGQSEEDCRDLEAAATEAAGEEHGEAPEVQATCNCGKPKTLGAKRCPCCQKDSTNLCRALKSLGDEKAERWRNAIKTGGIDREEFTKQAAGKLPKDIAKMMEFRIEETFTEESTLEMVGTGDFLDEEDMRDKYKGKPKRLEAILN